MSTHLLVAAAYLEGLPQGTKLVLMAIADSGDEQTLESAPGLPKLRAWSGLSKSQALAVVAQLVTDGLVERVEAGRLGRRAVYRVFPNGVPAIPHPDEVKARYADSLAGGSGQPDPQVTPPVGDNPAQEGPAHRTLGSGEAPSRVRPTGPLHASTSVSIGEQPTRTPVESRRPAPPSTGFPGSRATAEEDRAIARRARGANDVPCPLHSDMIVPCGRCAHEAAKLTREDRAARLKRLRSEHRPPPTPKTRTARKPAAKTEEPTP
jgi:DNA-binding MarR family transcriptional regulator